MTKAKTESYDPDTGEVMEVPDSTEEAGSTEMVVQDTGNMPMSMADMQADGAKDRVRFDPTKDMTIPRIVLLQDLSDEIKPAHPSYIPGAKVGMFLNTVTSDLMVNFLFVPARYARKYIAWRPERGGLLNADVNEAFLQDPKLKVVTPGFWQLPMVPTFSKDGLPVMADIIETPEWAGIIDRGDGRLFPVVISFPSTKGRASRKINTEIDLLEQVGQNGVKFTPPPYASAFEISATVETNDKNSWFGYVARRMGWAPTEMYLKARDLKRAIDKGDLSTAEVTDADN